MRVAVIASVHARFKRANEMHQYTSVESVMLEITRVAEFLDCYG
jgi:hypothetical protein